MKRALLLVLIILSLALGAVIAYSILYIYPYQRGYRASEGQQYPIASVQTMTIVPEIISPPAALTVTQKNATEIQQLSQGVTPLATPRDLRGSLYQTAEITNISISDGKIYLSLRLIIGGASNLTHNISISKISLTPTPFPLGWNGSSWVYGDDEARCLARIPIPLKILSYRYRVSYMDNKTATIDLEITVGREKGVIYGPYTLSLLIKQGNTYINITRDIPLGGYIEPAGPPPTEILEKISRCR
ncbi:MAG: hypothetical protein QXQ57_01495 [Sulfolobales archaeon]